MASRATGVEGLVRGQKISVSNGRVFADGVEAAAGSEKMVPGWTLARNGFCLLTHQPMPVQQAIFEEFPGQFASSPFLFQFRGSEAEQVSADGAAVVIAPDSPYALYYKHIAEAVKEAMPEAEYVVIGGHISFSAEVSQLKQVLVLLGFALKKTVAGLLTKLLPGCVPKEEAKPESKGAEKPARAIPPFGATQFLHVDISAEQGAEKLGQSINIAAASGTDSAGFKPLQQLRLPVEFLSSTSKQRRVVSVNMWRNLRAEASIKSDHLCVLDAQTVTEEELRAAKFKNYAIGGQEQYHIAQPKDQHRLVYFPDMVQSEILCFKQGAYDVCATPGAAAGQYAVTPAPEPHTNHIFHTSFADPMAPSDALPRKSVVCAGVLVVMPETEVRQS